MPQERLPKQALLAKASGKRPVRRPRTRWTNGGSWMELLGTSVSCCPRNPHGKARNKEKEHNQEN